MGPHHYSGKGKKKSRFLPVRRKTPTGTNSKKFQMRMAPFQRINSQSRLPHSKGKLIERSKPGGGGGAQDTIWGGFWIKEESLFATVY